MMDNLNMLEGKRPNINDDIVGLSKNYSENNNSSVREPSSFKTKD